MSKHRINKQNQPDPKSKKALFECFLMGQAQVNLIRLLFIDRILGHQTNKWRASEDAMRVVSICGWAFEKAMCSSVI